MHTVASTQARRNSAELSDRRIGASHASGLQGAESRDCISGPGHVGGDGAEARAVMPAPRAPSARLIPYLPPFRRSCRAFPTFAPRGSRSRVHPPRFRPAVAGGRRPRRHPRTTAARPATSARRTPSTSTRTIDRSVRPDGRDRRRERSVTSVTHRSGHRHGFADVPGSRHPASSARRAPETRQNRSKFPFRREARGIDALEGRSVPSTVGRRASWLRVGVEGPCRD